MAYSNDFGSLVTAIIGNDSLAVAGQKIGVSGTYVGNLKKGLVPKLDVIESLSDGYNVSTDIKEQLMNIASTARASSDPERMIIAACDAAGLDTMARYAVIEAFRAQKTADNNHRAA